jgi:hypothetical protein
MHHNYIGTLIMPCTEVPPLTGNQTEKTKQCIPRTIKREVDYKIVITVMTATVVFLLCSPL